MKRVILEQEIMGASSCWWLVKQECLHPKVSYLDFTLWRYWGLSFFLKGFVLEIHLGNSVFSHIPIAVPSQENFSLLALLYVLLWDNFPISEYVDKKYNTYYYPLRKCDLDWVAQNFLRRGQEQYGQCLGLFVVLCCFIS